jgi:hypothetical protein
MKNALSPANAFHDTTTLPFVSRAADSLGRVGRSMTGFLYRYRRSGAPHLARFSRDVGYHGTRRATLSVVIRRACDFFDLFVFSSYPTSYISSLDKAVPGDARCQMLLGAFRPQTTTEDKKRLRLFLEVPADLLWGMSDESRSTKSAPYIREFAPGHHWVLSIADLCPRRSSLRLWLLLS